MIPSGIDVYTSFWNEIAGAQRFVDHYAPIADRIVCFDHHSDDGSPDLIGRHPKVEVRALPDLGPDVFSAGARIRSTAWIGSDCTWAVVVDFDELLDIAELRSAIAGADETHTNAVAATGYSVVYENPGDPLRYIRDYNYDKPVAFRTSEIDDAQYVAGCHWALSPALKYGNVRPRLLHYRYLGREATWSRYQELRSKLSPADAAAGMGGQYLMRRDEFDARFDWILSASTSEPCDPSLPGG